MDYAASQTLVSDLLGDPLDQDDAPDAAFDVGEVDQQYDLEALNQPDLWSESEDGGEEAYDISQSDPSAMAARIKATMVASAPFRSRNAKKPPKKGRKAAHTLPSFELQSMLGQANQCYAKSNFDEALKIIHEVIRIDNRVFEAYQLLQEIHKTRKDIGKSLKAGILAAHLRPHEAQLWQELISMSSDLQPAEQTDVLYRRLIQAEPQNAVHTWHRALFNRAHDRPVQAIEACRRLLKLVPFEIGCIRQLAHLYYGESRVEDAARLYESASEHYMIKNEREIFTWSELNIMAEILVKLAQDRDKPQSWRDLILRINTVARWLRHRSFERWWDERVDDAEWDIDDKRRKTETNFVAPSAADSLDSFALPPEIRAKLARARLALGDQSEAMRHFDILDDVAAEKAPELLLEVADMLAQVEQWDRALKFYMKISDVESITSSTFWYSMAKAFKACEDFAQAEECLECIRVSEPRNTKVMVMLAEVYEQTDRRHEALEILNEVIELRRASEGDETSSVLELAPDSIEVEPLISHGKTRLPKPGISRTSRLKRAKSLSSKGKVEDLVAHERRKTEETLTKFKALHLSRKGLLMGDPDCMDNWSLAASELIDDFRNITLFYPSERNHTFQGIIRDRKSKSHAGDSSMARLQHIAHRLEESITAGRALNKNVSQLDEFRGVPFIQWLELFLQYAMLLADTDQVEDAFTVLSSACDANVFYQRHDFYIRIHLARMLLCIKCNEKKTGIEEVRWIMLNCLFRDDGLRLYCALLASGTAAIELFRDKANQKFMLRLIKTMDSVFKKVSIVGAVSVKDLADKPESILPTQMHPTLLVLYGHIIAANRGFVASLQYFSRAHAYIPEHPMVVFSMGLAYLHRSMQRQCDNRHAQIVQAFSFLLKYHDQRAVLQDEAFRHEADYNLGRALQQLGLPHLALRYYNRILEGPEVEAEYDLRASTAYNMQLIYILAGNARMARQLSERYLTI